MNIIFRRGSTASSDLYVGQDATISIDTDKNQIRVHDGVTPGGHPVANISDLADYVQQSLLGASNGVATLDANGKLDLSQIPQITITDVFDAESEEEMLDVDAQRGDVVIRYDLNRTFILKGDDPTDIDQWQVLPTPTDVVLSVNGQVGTVSLAAGHIPYSNTTSGLASDDVQEAIDELQSTKADKGTLGSMAGETASDYIKKNTPFPIIGGGGSLAHAAYTLTRPSDSADPYYIVVGKRGAGVGSTHVIGTFYMGRPWDSSNRPAGVMNVICHSTNTGSSFSVMLQGTFNVDGFDRVHLMHNGVNYLAIKFSQPQFLQFDRFVFNGIAGDGHLFILEESQVTDVTVIPENTSTGTTLGLKGLNIPSSAISGFGNVDPPATSTSPGSPGQFAYDSNYFYVYVANNTWRRVELSSW